MDDRVMLFSGGMDCYIAWRLLRRPPAVYFNLGHRYAADEQAGIHRIMRYFPTADIRIETGLRLGRFEEQGGSYIPFRNLFMLLYAHQQHPAHEYVIGQVLEWQTDKNAAFYRQTEQTFARLGKRPAEIYAPLAGMSKTDAVAAFLRAGYSGMELTTMTRSCVQPGPIPCGECPNCMFRWIALKNNGISERMLSEPNVETFRLYMKRKGMRFALRHPIVTYSRLAQAWRAFA
jgi:7-cyano-7-deazaguanine synthase in queuosine biosynthesis